MGVFFCRALPTMFTASLCSAKLFIPSFTVLTYSRFIDLGVVYLRKKEAEKNKDCVCSTKRRQEDWNILAKYKSDAGVLHQKHKSKTEQRGEQH